MQPAWLTGATTSPDKTLAAARGIIVGTKYINYIYLQYMLTHDYTNSF